ncbi:MAG: hypothetical protein KAX80_06295, partial [Planctomycetes bacterium]|nr:hypothetical protein [Planctomycetota bacterium]
EVVGGPGKEFWSDGENYPISNKSKECEPGAWRIEVYPGAPRERDFFCHLLFTAGSSREAAPAVQMTDGEYVQLSFADGGRDYVVSFTKDGPVGGHVKVSEGTVVLIDQDFTRTVQPQRFEPGEAWK